MCQKCWTDPEIIPSLDEDAMIPAVVVHDVVNARIIVAALTEYCNDYITVAEGITTDPRCTPTAQMIHMHNMINVTDRVTAMIVQIIEQHPQSHPEHATL